ncbi:MAG TPA: hypothetical protein VFV08_04400, partial [Puia sp.]|nr:hypothetical protein [Puia sp.]
MGKSNAKATLLRKTLITSSVLGLIVLFFVLNYLVIVPRQQTIYNKKIFRILHEQSESIESIINAYSVSYKRSLKTQDQDPVFHWQKKYIDTLKFIQDLKYSFTAKDTLFEKQHPAPDVKTTFIRDSVLFEHFKKGKNHPGIIVERNAMSLANIIEPIQVMHEDIFDYIILTSKKITDNKNTLLYKSPALDVDEMKLSTDTVNKNTVYPFATLRDTAIEGTTYKLFTLPFRLNDQFLYLGGFIEEHEYKSNMAGSSYRIILLIGSLLIILVISLPFLKIFFLGRRENLTITD